MRRKWKQSVLGLALVSTALTPAVATNAGAQTGGWNGFEAISAPSAVHETAGNSSPAFSAAVTNDLGGPGVDLWVNNHAESSETLADFIDGANVFSAVNRVTPAGSPDVSDSHVGVFTDIDDDGDEDFIETAGRGDENRVFINDNGLLSEVSNHGLEDAFGRSRTILNVDINNDGHMDAVVATLDSRFNDEDGDGEPDVEPSTLFLNDGDGTFTEVVDTNNVLFDESIPLTSGAQNVRFLNLTSTGPGTDQVIVASNSFSFGLATLATDTTSIVSAGTPVTQSLGADDNATQLREIVLGDLDGDLAPEWVAARQQDGLGTIDPTTNEEITEIALPIGIGEVTAQGGPEALVNVSNSPLASNCRTVSLGDFDNDADLDIFGGCAMLANGQTTNIVLINDGAGNFTVDSASVPTTGAITSTVSLVADFNDDGWVDTYVGGGFDTEPGEDFIFLNEGGTNNYLKIDLVGSNPDVMGAQVFVGTDKWQVRETGHRLHYGQDSSTLHFGLGTESSVAPVEIQWPDGTFESCTVAGINQTVTITQGSAACTSQSAGQFQAALNATPNNVTDTAGPVITPLVPTTGSTMAPRAAAVFGSATDETDVERVRIRVRRNDGNGLDYWDGDKWISSPTWVDVTINDTGSWILRGVDFTTPGAYFVWGIGNDSLGNQSSAAANGKSSFTVVDSTGPVVTPIKPTNGSVMSPRAAAVFGASSDASDVERVRIRVRRNDGNGLDYWDGDRWISSPTWVDADVSANGAWILRGVDFTTPGAYFVWGIGNDSAGNQSSAVDNGKLAFTVR